MTSGEVGNPNDFQMFIYLEGLCLIKLFKGFSILWSINICEVNVPFQVGMTKTDAAVQTLSDINPDVVLEASVSYLNKCAKPDVIVVFLFS